VLSGAHQVLFEELMQELRNRQADDILVFGGGIIPEADIAGLKALGVTEVFGPGTPLPVIVEWVGAHVPDHGA
jgi:methylmalonyl-CoA mutase C-terminal domain/subunit